MLGSSLSGNNLPLSAHHMSSIAGARHAVPRMLQLLKGTIVFKAIYSFSFLGFENLVCLVGRS